jgi:hypothetical protein
MTEASSSRRRGIVSAWRVHSDPSISGLPERLSVSGADRDEEGPMKYVCLVYVVEKEIHAMTKREADTCRDESLAYDDALRKAGHLIVAQIKDLRP